jgi:hypothetical protein
MSPAMTERKLRWLLCDPANPTVPIRQTSNPEAAIAGLRVAIAKAPDNFLRDAWQKQLDKLEAELRSK